MNVAWRSRSSAAADASALLIRLGLVVLFVGLPFAGLGLSGAIYALLPVGGGSILCGAAMTASTRGLHRLRDALLTPLSAAALLAAAWAGLSLLWTPFPGAAGEKYFKMIVPAALAGLAAAHLPDKTKSFDLYLLPFGVAATAAATLALDFLGPPTFFDAAHLDETLRERTTITLIVLLWPALGALALREHWITGASLAVLVAAVSLVDVARGALAAMGAGAFVFALAMTTPSRIASALAVASAAAILLAPLLAVGLAAGFGTFGEIPAPIASARDIVVGQWPRLVTGHGLELANIGQSHGFVPQDAPRGLLFLLWYDLGAPGAAAFAAMVALAFTAAGKVPSLLGPSLLAGLVCVLTIAVLGVAVAQIWFLTLLDCAALGFVLVGRAVPRTHRPDAIEIESDGAGTPGARAEPGGSARPSGRPSAPRLEP